MRATKILQVTAALDQGGVERGTVEMASYITDQGAQSFVASHGGRMVSTLEKQGSRHITMPLSRRDPLTIVWCALRIWWFIRQEKIDLVHARSRAPAWAALIACRLTGTPFVTTFHGTHRLQNRLKRLYNSVMARGVRVIAISQFIKKHIMINYAVPEALIDVAARGFEPTIFNPELISQEQCDALKQSLGVTQGVPVVTLPGRLTRWKGQTLFLEALAQVKEVPWQALLVGGAGKKESYLDELKKLVKQHKIEDRVFFVGDQGQIAPFYAISDLVVSASMEPEAFGRVAVEAQAMGKPVLASAHGGSLETVKDGETGWFFNVGRADDLAAKLRTILTADSDLVEVGQNAQKWVKANYTVEAMCKAEWASYHKVLLQKS